MLMINGDNIRVKSKDSGYELWIDGVEDGSNTEIGVSLTNEQAEELAEQFEQIVRPDCWDCPKCGTHEAMTDSDVFNVAWWCTVCDFESETHPVNIDSSKVTDNE